MKNKTLIDIAKANGFYKPRKIKIEYYFKKKKEEARG